MSNQNDKNDQFLGDSAASFQFEVTEKEPWGFL
jgi:hypothetical protein